MKRTGYIRAFCLLLAMTIMMLTPMTAFAADSVIRIDGRYSGQPALLKWQIWKIGTREPAGLKISESFEASGVVLEGMTDEEVREAADKLAKFIEDNSVAPDFTAEADSEGITEAAVGAAGVYFLSAEERIADNKKYTASPAIVEFKEGADTDVMPKIEAEDQPDIPDSDTDSHGSDSTPDSSYSDDNDSRKSGAEDESGGKKTGADDESGSKRPGGDTDSESTIPQTGQLWWPVPVMAVAGLILVALGLRVSSKKDSGHDE